MHAFAFVLKYMYIMLYLASRARCGRLMVWSQGCTYHVRDVSS